MKKFIILTAIVLAALKGYCQQNPIPQVAFLVNDTVIKIDSATFDKLLVEDTLKICKDGRFCCSNYSDIFSKNSLGALILYLNPTINKGYSKQTKILLPSYDLCTKYIKDKTQKTGASGNNTSSFDIIIYPSLRDTLEKIASQITECKYYDIGKIDSIRTIKVTINALLTQNKPLSKMSLESLINISKNIAAPCQSNYDRNDASNSESLASYQNTVFKIFRNSINLNINDNYIPD